MASELSSPTPYNPLEKQHLADSVAQALLRVPIGPLPPERQFRGAGVYALYYTGGFPQYAPIASVNRQGQREAPIYVGEAVPAGSRRGDSRKSEEPGAVLRTRLHQHARSIDQAQNLDLGDFGCRFLVVDDIWIPLAETLMIQRFSNSSVWNTVLDGFGIHDPGKGRADQKRSAWDTLHPGRPFADSRPANEHDAEFWAGEVVAWLAGLS